MISASVSENLVFSDQFFVGTAGKSSADVNAPIHISTECHLTVARSRARLWLRWIDPPPAVLRTASVYIRVEGFCAVSDTLHSSR